MDNLYKYTNNMKFYTQEECLIGLSEMQWKEFFELSFIKQIGHQFGVQNFSSVWRAPPQTELKFFFALKLKVFTNDKHIMYTSLVLAGIYIINIH